MKALLTVPILATAATSPALAQTASSFAVDGRSLPPSLPHGRSLPSHGYPLVARGLHSVGIDIGILSRTTTTAGGGAVSADTKASGFVGAVRYEYWAGEYWTIGASLGFVAADASAAADGTSSAAVVPILGVVRYYPPQLAISELARPYGSMALGPYVGFETESGVGSSTDAAFGARARAGVDLFPGRRLLVGASVGYNFVTSFEQPIGRDKNYSGVELSLTLRVLLGPRPNY